MISVFLMNLGTGDGAWVNLPMDSEELSSFIRTNKISTRINEEYIIADYENEDFPITITEYTSVWELNEMAEEFFNLEDYEQEVIKAYMECCSSSFSEVKTLIEDHDDLFLVSDIEDAYDLGHYLIEDTLAMIKNLDTIVRYFDYEAFGRDCLLEGNMYLTSFGCLFC